LFGEVADGEMKENKLGRIVQSVWYGLPQHYLGVECDAFVVMPNHVHGIIFLTDVAQGEPDVGAGLRPARVGLGRHRASTPRAGLRPAPTPLSELVRAFKSFSARCINEMRGKTGIAVWQRNFYEHIVRDADELNRIREYIVNNPLQWELDRENPDRKEINSAAKPEPWEV